MAVVEGDVEETRQEYVCLDRIPRTLQRVPHGQIMKRLLGVIAHGADMPEEAAAHFREAVTFCRKGGYLPQLAWTCCDYADVLLERDSVADRGKVLVLVEEGLAIARDLGMRPLVERILVRQKRLAG
jgi:hypothetical protein